MQIMEPTTESTHMKESINESLHDLIFVSFIEHCITVFPRTNTAHSRGQLGGLEFGARGWHWLATLHDQTC